MKQTGWSPLVRWTAVGIVAIGLLVLVRQKGPGGIAPPAPAPGAPSALLAQASGPDAKGVGPSPSPFVAEDAPAQAGFELLLSRARAKLPEQGAFNQHSSEDVHAPPKALADAALALGEVAEAVSRDPSLVPRAREFYSECALGNHPNTVRAFCLARARHHEPGKAEPAWAAGLPLAVRELSQKVRLD